MNEIPPIEKIKASLKRYEQEQNNSFYTNNMKRITEILNEFVEKPGMISKDNKAWLYIYEKGKISLVKEREHLFRKELDLILDKLKEKGYNCKTSAREDYVLSKRCTIVTLDIDFNEDKNRKNNFWTKLFKKDKK